MALTKLNNRSLSGALTSSQVPAAAASTTLSGTPIQIVHSVFDENLLINSGTNKFIEKAITTTAANSKILADIRFHQGHPGSYNDHDLVAGVGWKTGSAASGLNEYNGTGGYGFTRHALGNGVGGTPLHPYWVTDTHPAGTAGTQYYPWAHSVIREISPAVASGTTIQVALWCATDGQMALGRYYGSTYSDGGAQSSITIYEIKA